MIELSNAECISLAALLVKVGRPHSAAEAAELEQWVARLSRRSTWVVPHDGDLLA